MGTSDQHIEFDEMLDFIMGIYIHVLNRFIKHVNGFFHIIQKMCFQLVLIFLKILLCS